MNRVVIVSGGHLGDWALACIHPDDTLIGADRGASYLVSHGFKPHIAVGDFDSVSEAELEQIRSHCDTFESFDPVMKDYSDTELAFRLAVQLNPNEIVLLGAVGTRFDHTLANVHLLLKGLQMNIRCKLIDEYNEIVLIDREAEIANPGGSYQYVSLLPLTMKVRGVTLDGFQYPLNNATLTMGQSLAVSNVLLAERGTVRISDGLLLVIQSKD